MPPTISKHTMDKAKVMAAGAESWKTRYWRKPMPMALFEIPSGTKKNATHCANKTFCTCKAFEIHDICSHMVAVNISGREPV